MSDAESEKSTLDADYEAWKALFVKDGQIKPIKISELEEILKDKNRLELRAHYNIQDYHLKCDLKDLKKKVDKDKDGKIDFEEWVNYYHKENLGGKARLQSAFKVPMSEPISSWLPLVPIFILIISVSQVGFYIWQQGQGERDNADLKCSYLIYDPYKRQEAWRFLTYQFVHDGPQHIVNNIVIQLILGVTLELSQRGWLGKLKLLTLYMAGVLLGSLAHTIISPAGYLCGASAGLYTLIAAHLATLIINWTEDGDVYKMRKNEQRYVPLSQSPIARSFVKRYLLLMTYCLSVSVSNNSYYSIIEESAWLGL